MDSTIHGEDNIFTLLKALCTDSTLNPFYALSLTLSVLMDRPLTLFWLLMHTVLYPSPPPSNRNSVRQLSFLRPLGIATIHMTRLLPNPEDRLISQTHSHQESPQEPIPGQIDGLITCRIVPDPALGDIKRLAQWIESFDERTRVYVHYVSEFGTDGTPILALRAPFHVCCVLETLPGVVLKDRRYTLLRQFANLFSLSWGCWLY